MSDLTRPGGASAQVRGGAGSAPSHAQVRGGAGSAPSHAQVRGGAGSVPLRPLTTGELLDAGIALLRTRAPLLLGLGVLLAVVEQVVLYPLRASADVDGTLFPATGRLTPYALSVILGFATEAMIISTIAAVAATRAATALLGSAAPARPPLRPASVAGVVLVVGAVVALTATPYLLLDRLQVIGFLVAGMLVALLWPLPYGLVGLAAPAVVTEGRGAGPALGRSLQLASRDGMRVVFLRVLAYGTWATARVGLLVVLVLFYLYWGGLPSSTWDRIVLAVAAGLVNAVAYPVLGCMDAMLLLEARMRTEGLDISLRWAQRRGVAPSLAAPLPRGAATRRV